MEYIAYVEQSGEGCDCTIGCGNRIISLGKHPDAESASKNLMEIIYEKYNPRNSLETVLREAWVLSFNCKIDMKKYNSDMLAEVLKEKEDQERIEYERLKKKFGQ
jgi:hypothetical protein